MCIITLKLKKYSFSLVKVETTEKEEEEIHHLKTNKYEYEGTMRNYLFEGIGIITYPKKGRY